MLLPTAQLIQTNMATHKTHKETNTKHSPKFSRRHSTLPSSLQAYTPNPANRPLISLPTSYPDLSGCSYTSPSQPSTPLEARHKPYLSISDRAPSRETRPSYIAHSPMLSCPVFRTPKKLPTNRTITTPSIKPYPYHPTSLA